MNKYRRQDLLDVCSILDDGTSRLSEIRDEEQEAYDNLPDGLQAGKTGDSMLTAIDSMDYFINEIDKLRGDIEFFANPPKKRKTKNNDE